MTSFIDTHCHLEMLGLPVQDIVALAGQVGVHRIVTIATDEASIRFVLQTVERYPQIYGSLGFHPHEASTYTEAIARQILDRAGNSAKIIAVGETGLDYHYMHSGKKIQQTVFAQQLVLAEQLQLPVILHSREAREDTLDILKANPLTRKGVAHSFTSGLRMAKDLLEMDWYIGINGITTFRNAEEVREVMRYVPLDRLLLETDAPFLTPIPFRGKPNDPSKIPLIAEFIAIARNISLQSVAAQTTENATRLFQLPS